MPFAPKPGSLQTKGMGNIKERVILRLLAGSTFGFGSTKGIKTKEAFLEAITL